MVSCVWLTSDDDTMRWLAAWRAVPGSGGGVQVLIVVEAPRLLASLMPGRKATAE